MPHPQVVLARALVPGEAGGLLETHDRAHLLCIPRYILELARARPVTLVGIRLYWAYVCSVVYCHRPISL